ncbi:hypothetical protein ACT009_11555 [Sphingomonas sp. Tas61C01]|uniref:hypothetical protein n=1 Tax=Sphingomonas sp. Tas61C01 TaxID=3458297 RepID=UPI00403EE7A8
MTSGVDLAALMDSIAHIDAMAIDHLKALGVTGSAIAEINIATRHPAIGVVDAEPVGNGLFQIGAGPRHLVQPITVDGEIIDLVAWRSLRPDDWRLLRGVGWALGEDQLNAARSWTDQPPPMMLRTPLDFLRAAGSGFVVTDWSAPAVRSLIDFEAIDVADRALGDVLLNTISKPLRLPRVNVRRRRDELAS